VVQPIVEKRVSPFAGLKLKKNVSPTATIKLTKKSKGQNLFASAFGGRGSNKKSTVQGALLGIAHQYEK
jgi:hypothetical protein